MKHRTCKTTYFRCLLPVSALTLLLWGSGCGRPLDGDLESILESRSIEVESEEFASLENAASVNDASSEGSADTTFSEETLPEIEPPSLEKFLRTALLPVGSTAYIWGGGWNEEDTGAGEEAVTLGLSPRWKEFADTIGKDYSEDTTRYQIHDGLDCSGFVGWAVYNTLETEEGKEGYVLSAAEMAKHFAEEKGFGYFLPAKSVKDWAPGDIASMSGHVWISLGTCKDGSVLLVHSSPPGVKLSGTGKEAIALAKELMSTYYPDWYERFPDCKAPASYVKKSAQMRWNTETFADAAELQKLSAEEIAELLFTEERKESDER